MRMLRRPLMSVATFLGTVRMKVKIALVHTGV
jgi:hypothetical protein